MLKRAAFLMLLPMLCMGASNCTVKRLKPDVMMSALEAHDSTAFVEGCGSQPISGYTYCRKMAGAPTTEKLIFHAPPAECPGSDPCVSLKIYRLGADPIGRVFPRGQTRVEIEWKELVARSVFAIEDRGFWPFDYTITWLDRDKRVQTTFVDGEVRLVVFTKGYVSLTESPDDPAFAWEWSEGNFVFKMTTGGRAYVGREKL